MHRHSRPRGPAAGFVAAAATAVVLVALAAVPSSAQAAAPPSAPAPAPAPAPGASGQDASGQGESAQETPVTLITGDRVIVRTVAGRTDLEVQPARRSRPASFEQFTRHGDRYVLPDDAATLVQDGVLDWELFNVTGLVRQGYDDNHTASVPLLLRYGGAGVGTPAAVPAAPAATVARQAPPGPGMSAVDEQKNGAASFWSRLLPPAGVHHLAAGGSLPGGIREVWLNGPAQAADGSVTTRTAPSTAQDDGQYDLTVDLINRDGVSATPTGNSQFIVVNLDTAYRWLVWGSGTLRLPPGRYAVHGTIETPRAGQEPSYTQITQPELRLDHDTVAPLDARDGKPVSITPANPAARGGNYAAVMLDKVTGCGCVYSETFTTDPRFNPTFAATVPGTSAPSFAFAQTRRATEPTVELSTRTAQPFEIPVDWLADAPSSAQRADLSAVYGGQGTPEDLRRVDARGKLVVIEVPGDLADDELDQRIAAITRAGGRLAMVDVRADPTGAAALTRLDSGGSDPGATALFADGPTAQRFTDLVKTGEVAVSYVNRPVSDVRYDLAYGVQRQLTTAAVHRPSDSDLVAVHTSYYDNVADSSRYVAAASDYFGTMLFGGPSEAVRAPALRTEYFTPGSWTLESDSYWGPRDALSQTLNLAVGGHYQVAWNKAVAAPSFSGTTAWPKGSDTSGPRPWAMRDGGAIDVILPMYGDSAGRPRTPFSLDGTDTGSISLYRDGTLVGTEPVPEAARFDVPADAAAYRLDAQTRRAVAWWPLSTEVSASWTFRSSAADDGAALPLLAARFDPALDLRNRAPGGTFSFPSYVQRQGGDPVTVTSYTVEVSYDDGGTWQPAGVSRTGDHWTVCVRQPVSGYASLRATATDADGDSVRQTVIRAYQIGG